MLTRAVSPGQGVVFFLCFVGIIWTFSINILVAIVSDAYQEETEELEKKGDEITVNLVTLKDLGLENKMENAAQWEAATTAVMMTMIVMMMITRIRRI